MFVLWRYWLRTLTSSALAVLFVSTLAGCVSRSKAEAQARYAYLAGQRAALMEMQQHSRDASVTFVGPVNNPVVKWTDGLTLSQGILNAGYNSHADPRLIVIRRSGQQIPIDPKRLLAGDDVPLEPRDIIEIQQ
jgi:hypothetical protein